MVTPRRISVVQTRHVRRHAERAITRRLRYFAPRAIIGVWRDPDQPGTVILHVNSGGNAAECEVALRHAGYATEPTGYDPFAKGHYGVQLRVLPASSATATWKARQQAREGRRSAVTGGRRLAPHTQAVEDAVLAVLRDAAGFPLSTGEIAERIGRPGPAASQQLVYPRLARLARRGIVARSTMPGFRWVYWQATAPGTKRTGRKEA